MSRCGPRVTFRVEDRSAELCGSDVALDALTCCTHESMWTIIMNASVNIGFIPLVGKLVNQQLVMWPET